MVLRKSSLTTFSPTSTGASCCRGSTSQASAPMWYVEHAFSPCLSTLITNLYRLMPVIPPTLTASSPKKPRKTPMSMAPFFLRLCSNNSKAGLTTARLPVSVTPVAASRTRHSEASQSEQIDNTGQQVYSRPCPFPFWRNCLKQFFCVHSA